MAGITEREQQQVGEANASGHNAVVFIHGLWLLPSSWDRWQELFRAAGYATLAPGWPDDPETVAEAKAHPDVFAGKSIKDVADHLDAVVRQLNSPAPFRGVLPLPLSALRSASPALLNPLNYNRAVPLTYDQFRYAFANAVTEPESHELYDTYAVPAPGKPLFQAALANINPWTEARVDTTNSARGPLLILDGELDHTVPWSIANASFNRQKGNPGVTEIQKIPGRGHALTIDSGWREVAEISLAFAKRFVPAA